VNDLLVDLMPPEARRIPAMRRRMRLMRLASVLVAVLVVGVVTDSIAQARRAQVQRDVARSLRENAQRIDGLLADSLRERDMLKAELAASRLLRGAVPAADVVATVSHLLPREAWLESMRISMEEVRPVKDISAKQSSGTPRMARPTYIVSIAGWAAAPEDVSEFANRLASMQPFTDVGVTEQRGVPGSRAQQFALRFRIGTGAATASARGKVSPADGIGRGAHIAKAGAR
jgi:hypothetical protein